MVGVYDFDICISVISIISVYKIIVPAYDCVGPDSVTGFEIYLGAEILAEKMASPNLDLMYGIEEKILVVEL